MNTTNTPTMLDEIMPSYDVRDVHELWAARATRGRVPGRHGDHRSGSEALQPLDGAANPMGSHEGQGAGHKQRSPPTGRVRPRRLLDSCRKVGQRDNAGRNRSVLADDGRPACPGYRYKGAFPDIWRGWICQGSPELPSRPEWVRLPRGYRDTR